MARAKKTEKKIDAERELLAKASLMIKRVAVEGVVRAEDCSVLYDTEDLFRRRCRRLDRWRKRTGNKLARNAVLAQMHARGSVTNMIRSAAILGGIDLASGELSEAEVAQARDVVTSAAAVLLDHFDVIEAGGITREFIERKQSPAN